MNASGAIYTVDAGVLTPLISTITDNVAILIPAGIGITVMIMGAKMIPRLLKGLVKG